ncbi:MAG TPA: cyanophycinase [Salegentibacter sp.]|nr:cyanophycinase [Salegentibacter sp.]
MKYTSNSILFTLLTLLVFGTPMVSSAQGDKEGSLFIIGGGSRPEKMLQRIISESGIDKDGYGVILPMSSAEPDSAVFYAKKQFTELDQQNIFGLHFQKDEVISEEKLDSLRNAKLIYISGGDQDRFMQVVANTPIEEAIKQNFTGGGMIAGTSAGAAVMSKKMITGTELRHPSYHSTFLHMEKDNLETKDGLGLIENVIIDQHFVRRSRYNRLLTAIIEYPELIGIGIDEATAILVRGTLAEVVGNSQVIVMSNPTNSNINSEEKIAARDLRLDIYLNGETFELE